MLFRSLRAFLGEPALFGEPTADGNGPTLSLGSVHHLLKVVNGSTLRRPAWYFDTRIQGEGIVDVTTHLVDLAQWLLCPGQRVEFERDIRLDAARRWATPVSLESFERITGTQGFPDSLRTEVQDGTLPLYCNGEIRYRLKGLPVQVNVAWHLEQPPGGGDTHLTIARGTRADLIVRQLPERGFRKEFAVVPKEAATGTGERIRAALARHLPEWTDVIVEPQGHEWIVGVPPTRQTTHEQHFCEARDAFLREVATGKEPAEHRVNLVTKYRLLAAARALARIAPAVESGRLNPASA